MLRHKCLRFTRELSQAQLGALVKLSQPMLSHFESGWINTTAKELRALGAVLGCAPVGQINPAEAAVVRDSYQRYADGAGFKQIGHTLNAQGVRAPKAATWSVGDHLARFLHCRAAGRFGGRGAGKRLRA